MINLNTLKSWEFVVLLLTNVGAWLATTGSTVHTRDAFVYTAVSAGAYALARGFAKFNSDGKPFWRTTEFYVVIIGGVSAAWAGFQGHISSTTFTEVGAFLTAAAAIANGLRTPPDQAV